MCGERKEQLCSFSSDTDMQGDFTVKNAEFEMGILFQGALDNILKFPFWLYFIYQVKFDCLFTNTKRKIQKFLLKVKKSSTFVKHA